MASNEILSESESEAEQRPHETNQNEIADSTSTSITRKARYSLELKQKIIVEHSKSHNLSELERIHNIDRRIIGVWVKNKHKIESTFSDCLKISIWALTFLTIC